MTTLIACCSWVLHADLFAIVLWSLPCPAASPPALFLLSKRTFAKHARAATVAVTLTRAYSVTLQACRHSSFLPWPCRAHVPFCSPPATEHSSATAVAMALTAHRVLGLQAWNACFSWVLHAGLLAFLLRAMALPATVPWLDLFAYTGYAYIPACAIIVAGVLAGGCVQEGS